MIYRFLFVFMIFSVVLVSTSCTGGGARGNSGNVQTFQVYSSEADWIRNGEPLEFEGELWYPADGVESFMDSEVVILGEFRGVQFFADKVDVRPYSRLYTKFDKNKFRYFKRRVIE